MSFNPPLQFLSMKKFRLGFGVRFCSNHVVPPPAVAWRYVCFIRVAACRRSEQVRGWIRGAFEAEGHRSRRLSRTHGARELRRSQILGRRQDRCGCWACPRRADAAFKGLQESLSITASAALVPRLRAQGWAPGSSFSTA
jgi:hypothetical protein